MHRKKIDGKWIVQGEKSHATKKTVQYVLPEIDRIERRLALICFFSDVRNKPLTKNTWYPAYSEYLRTEHWKNVKIAMYSKSLRDNGKALQCIIENCSKPHVVPHHMRYDRLGTEFEQYDIIPLCRHHHKEVHKYCMAITYDIKDLYTTTQDYVNKKNKQNKLTDVKTSIFYKNIQIYLE